MTLPFGQTTFAELYERELVNPLFRPFAELIVAELGVSRGDRVLDIACGTGITARLAKDRSGEGGAVVGVDINPQMLSVARRLRTDIEWREGDAAQLPVRADERFDVVVCEQGFQFFPDKPRAAHEMRRVLAPRGRLGIGTWRPDEEVPLGRELRRVAEKHLGPIADTRHSFGEPGALEAILREAGFTNIQSRTLSHTVVFPEGEAFIRLNAMALTGMSARGKQMSDEQRSESVETLVRDSAEAAAPYTDGRKLAFELRTNFTTAMC